MAKDPRIKSDVWIEASMTVLLNRQQIELLDKLLGWDLARPIREHVTTQVPEERVRALFGEIARQVGPVAAAIRTAENELKARAVEVVS